MSSLPYAAALVLAVVVPAALTRAYAEIDDAFLDDWARDRGVELAPEHRPVVASYLRGGRIRRTWGVLAGVLVPTLVDLVVNGRLTVLGFSPEGSAPYAGPMEAVIGYLLGALYAELSLARPLDPARRSASLLPRDLSQYLPSRLLWTQRGLGLAVAVGAVAVALVPYPDSISDPGVAGPLFFGAAFVAFAAALEALERWLVRRRQPFTSPALVAIDDAIRSQSLHTLAGAGLALLLLACSGVFAVLTASDVPALRWTMWLPALVTFVLAIRACLGIGQQAWRVRRPVARPRGAAPA